MAKNTATSGVSRTGVHWEATTAPRTRAGDWDHAKRHFRTRNAKDWVNIFTLFPEVGEAILRDIAHKGHWERQRRDGKASKPGRRPSTIGGTLEDLYRITAPEYSVEAFPQAFSFLGLGSVNKVARGAGIAKSVLYRAVNGEEKPSMHLMEQVADYAGMSPAYFKEWRIAYVLTAMDEIMQARPEICLRWAKGVGTLESRAMAVSS